MLSLRYHTQISSKFALWLLWQRQIFRARFSCKESHGGQNLQGTFAIHGSKAPLSAVSPFVSLWRWMDVMVLGVSNSQLIYLRFYCIKILLIICLHFLSVTFYSGVFGCLLLFLRLVIFQLFPCWLLPLRSRSVFALVFLSSCLEFSTCLLEYFIFRWCFLSCLVWGSPSYLSSLL